MRRALLAVVVLAVLPGQIGSDELGPLAGQRVLGHLATAGPIGGVSLEDVVWEAVVNCAPTGNTLTKNAGGTAWNAGAVSTRGILSGDGYAESTPTNTTGNRMYGLSNGNLNVGYADIDFALYLAAGNLYVYEGGASKGGVGAFAPGDVLRVAVEAGAVVYRKNGALLYTSSNSPSYPLLVDTSIQHEAAAIEDVVLYGVLGDNGI